jgi:RNA polymerase sigma-70 factor (ECF subfamily)
MIIDNMPSPEEGMIINQNLDELLNTIKSLKKEYRKILQLRFFEDYSYKEISLELNQPLNTVKVKILRAKRLLAEKLNKK